MFCFVVVVHVQVEQVSFREQISSEVDCESLAPGDLTSSQTPPHLLLAWRVDSSRGCRVREASRAVLKRDKFEG